MKTRMIIEFMVLSLEAGLAAGETGTYKGLFIGLLIIDWNVYGKYLG